MMSRFQHFYADLDDVVPTLCVDASISMLMMMLFQHFHADDDDVVSAFYADDDDVPASLC